MSAATIPDGTNSASAIALSVEAAERLLAERIRDGQVDAFAALLGRYWPPLVRYSVQRLGSQDAAEDVVQEVFVRLWSKRRSLKSTASPRAYLYRLAHNATIDELRKRQVRTSGHVNPALHAAAPSTPVQVTEANELEAAAARAIAALPERRREVFVLGHHHDLSYRQIAETLSITERTVANHMTLALADLRIALRPFLSPND